ncbi:MAG: FixH family protein [Bacteroidales bacterium]|nr:FixH family protein [Bacteroidales bacterium]
MNIKFNWGTGIFITILIMIAWLGFLISKSFEYKLNMDADDYYERGLDHSAQMNRIKSSIPYKAAFTVELQDEFLIIHYPPFFAGKKASGELWFYRPSDYELDKKIAVDNQEDNIQKIHIQHFTKGRYILRASVTVDSHAYFFEHEILIK